MKRIIILFFLTIVASVAVAQDHSIRYEHLNIKNGLSSNRVSCIYKDKLDYMWFGTNWGLNRFDGYEFVNYFHDPNAKELGLTHNSILWIAEGPRDEIYILTGAGMVSFDIYKNRFVDISKFISDLPVYAGTLQRMLKDKNGVFWFVSNGFGVFKMSKEGEIQYLKHGGRSYQNRPDAIDILLTSEGDISILHADGSIVSVDVDTNEIVTSFKLVGDMPNGTPLRFYQDRLGGYWLFSRYGSEGVFHFQTPDSKAIVWNEKTLGANLVSDVIEDDEGHVIVATDHGGATRIDIERLTYSRSVYSPSDPTSLSHYGVISAFKDNGGTVWLGTNKGGVSFYNPNDNYFHYFKFPENEESLSDINAIAIDNPNKVWIGSDRGGLLTLNPETNKIVSLNKKSGQTFNDLKSNTIVRLLKDGDGLWIGTYHGGLSYYRNKRFINYKDLPGQYDLPGESIWALFKDSREQLWVGTRTGGIVVFDQNDQPVQRLNSQEGRIVSNYVTSIDEDENGNIWIGTGFGVVKYDPVTTKTTSYSRFVYSGPNSIIHNSVESLHCDQKGAVWIGTQNGISKYIFEEDTFLNYTTADGLVSGYIHSIEEDKNGTKWLSTNRGISSFTVEDGIVHIRNFNETEGLQSEIFNQNASDVGEDGTLAFGGANGLNLFKPEDIQPIRGNVRLVFNELYIANQQIHVLDTINQRVILKDGLNKIQALDLKHFENSFTIGFASLNYSRPDKVVYRYMLEGFDADWVYKSARGRRANYTNLDPGEYRLLVQSSSDIHDWGDEHIELKIKIDAPFWKTPWAYFLYVFLIISLIYLIIRVRLDRERLKSEIDHEKIEAKRLHELDLMKIRFFTNIGHEFRTPLTLILTPIERIIKLSTTAEHSAEYNIILRNAKRLLTLVNQLLDFRKMEAGKHQLSLSTGDLVRFMNDIVDSFSDLSNENKVIISLDTEFKEFLTRFDKDKLEKIMFNLFSNAFKFTRPGGKIDLRLAKEQNGEAELIKIQVADTGIGISEENLEHVFARFYQTDMPSNMVNHGSGIGLAITKEFVELHGGSITVESEVDKGTTFTVLLPLVDASLHSDEELAEVEQDNIEVLNNQKYTILLVEDNADFRFYLNDNLKQYFNILEAENGEVGLEKVFRHKPDVIVSDVMMPVMDGIEMVKELKKNRKAKHIPVILLSSHHAEEHKIEGLKAGASDFISKPFNFEILENRIKSALSLKEDIADSQKRIEVSPQEIAIASLDEKLIQKALEVVEENISNADFSVQELSHELGVSRAQLYKKVVSITGQSPIEFIRDIRLKRAALLLEKSQMSVSEIAYKVGFNNPRYFSNYFKAAYQVLPSKYVRQVQEEESVDTHT